MVDKEMGNATWATRRADSGKPATDDASPQRSRSFQQLGEISNPSNMRKKAALSKRPAAGLLDTVWRDGDAAYGIPDMGCAQL